MDDTIILYDSLGDSYDSYGKRCYDNTIKSFC